MKLFRQQICALSALVMLNGCSSRSKPAAQDAPPAPSAVEVAKPVKAAEPTVDAATLGITYSSRMKLGEQTLGAELDSTLARSAPWNGADGAWVTYQLVNPKVELTSGSSSKRDVVGLDSAFCVRTGASPRVALPRTLPAGARQLLLGLVSALEFNVSEDLRKTSWTAKERDVTGEYIATYTRKPDGWVAREKTSYVGVSFQVARSLTKAKVAADGLISEAIAAEQLLSPELQMDYQTTLRAALASQRGRVPQRLVGQLPADYEVMDLEKASAGAPGIAQVDMAPKKSFVDAYRELTETKNASFSAATLMSTAASLKAHPEEIEAVAKLLRTEPDRAAALSTLLVSVDTQPSKAALATVLKDANVPVDTKLEVMGSILLGGSFDDGLLAAAHQLASEGSVRLQRGAINIEGDLIRRASDKKSPEALRALRAQYARDAKACREPLLCAAYFAGLSYIATPEAIDLLHGALSNADESLRVAAIRSLESVEDPRVDTWLAPLLAGAPSATQERALAACAYRGSNACFSASKALLARGNDNQRVAVLRAIASGRFPKAAADAVLTDASAHDSSAAVRETAAKLVEKLRGAAPVAKK